MTKNSHGELESVSKEDHPIDCPLEIDMTPYCSSTCRSPPATPPIEELPNLKDFLRQRESSAAKRPRLEEKATATSTSDESISRHGNYRLFALINHLGGSSDVGKRVPSARPFLIRLFFEVITHRRSTTRKAPVGTPTTTRRSAFPAKITF